MPCVIPLSYDGRDWWFNCFVLVEMVGGFAKCIRWKAR